MVHRDCQPSPPLPVARNISTLAPKDLAGHRTDKGKFTVYQVHQVISHLVQLVCPQGEGLSSTPLVYLAGARGYLPPPLLYVNSQLEC
jgi:hypothetical protein